MWEAMIIFIALGEVVVKMCTQEPEGLDLDPSSATH